MWYWTRTIIRSLPIRACFCWHHETQGHHKNLVSIPCGMCYPSNDLRRGNAHSTLVAGSEGHSGTAVQEWRAASNQRELWWVNTFVPRIHSIQPVLSAQAWNTQGAWCHPSLNHQVKLPKAVKAWLVYALPSRDSQGRRAMKVQWWG